MQEVSVIIPNFNGMAYLDGVLAGMECQTVNNFEVILVDNGSSDNVPSFWVNVKKLRICLSDIACGASIKINLIITQRSLL